MKRIPLSPVNENYTPTNKLMNKNSFAVSHKSSIQAGAIRNRNPITPSTLTKAYRSPDGAAIGRSLLRTPAKRFRRLDRVMTCVAKNSPRIGTTPCTSRIPRTAISTRPKTKVRFDLSTKLHDPVIKSPEPLEGVRVNLTGKFSAAKKTSDKLVYTEQPSIPLLLNTSDCSIDESLSKDTNESEILLLLSHVEIGRDRYRPDKTEPPQLSKLNTCDCMKTNFEVLEASLEPSYRPKCTLIAH